MTTTLITGANKWLGYETARQLVAAGHDVYIGARDEVRGRRAADQLEARFIHLDVTDDGSVAAAAAVIAAAGGLDVLINNAGIAESTADGRFLTVAEVTADSVRTAFETNVIGVVRVTHAFLPLLQKSAAPVVVNVSSGLSLPRNLMHSTSPAHTYPGLAYPASKAALNVITVQYAKAFPDIRINVVNPGFAATDINGHTGANTVERGSQIIARMAQISPDGPSGGFFDLQGSIVW
jgi:NAD(P)-dependent dehydrogenase (short-subunit alcohol dehydrogenase family)